jgi:hypothetical protein
LRAKAGSAEIGKMSAIGSASRKKGRTDLKFMTFRNPQIAFQANPRRANDL